ncbi:nicotinate-nucleotide pyrophosphorylase [carboxylating] [Antricoccus suffuscus]|uniref:Nicotinate-nucleotide pyrophosphorylase [carboxylating] n=1 Tax=Antricoccus suffuscus TaxID=1629062 RepID=A0A2T0ZW25_9ACTN|nr:carboxylating nicotinate-nucleotide diphosphorylase [Antricoccus suffuscus]PRZ40494.1 nicotinate-nucleotide pyrophosphorylase [carboxylating] [Antricoccus suffuscus]
MLSRAEIHRIVQMAWDEDAPWGDVTSDCLIPQGVSARADLVAREPGVFCGGEVFAAAFGHVDGATEVEVLVDDGALFESGQVLATVRGSARSLLGAERIALNLVQRMSAIATTTARYAAETAGTKARIVDTRKTTPGLRAIERYAVRCGGGHNHRNSLSDAVMAKDNHLAVLGDDLTLALREARGRISHTTHFEVEVDRIDQIEPVLAAGVDSIMLDNFTLDELREGVAIIAGRAVVEASGGIELDGVREIAQTGVDVISVGALTHTIRSLDLGLDFATTTRDPSQNAPRSVTKSRPSVTKSARSAAPW